MRKRIIDRVYLGISVLIFLLFYSLSVILQSSLTPSYDVDSWKFIVMLLLPSLWTLWGFHMLIKDEWINRLVYEIKLGKFVGYANRAHETIKKKDLQLFFCFLILIVVFLSWRFGLFSEGIISNNDHSYHYYQAWYTVNYLIPKFNSII
ncbi:MAG: hypothetical protein ABH834_00895, partial [Candidatus Altiarchaeota archaeon]